MISADKAKFLKKKWWPAFGPNRPKSGPTKMSFFAIFLSLAFLGIPYNDSLRQFLTSSRDKTHEKNFLRSQI